VNKNWPPIFLTPSSLFHLFNWLEYVLLHLIDICLHNKKCFVQLIKPHIKEGLNICKSIRFECVLKNEKRKSKNVN